MDYSINRICVAIAIALSSAGGFAQSGAEQPGTGEQKYYTANDFVKIVKIDAHCHLNTFLTDFVLQAKQDNFRLISINLDDVNEPPPMEDLQQFALSQRRAFPAIVNYATTFSIRDFNDSGWLSRQEAYLQNSFDSGAVAVKIYKVIGMTLRDKSGQLVMIDDKRFDPILDFIERRNIPVLGHLGEPKNCWLPLREMTIEGDRTYFRQNPKYYMYLHPEFPSYEQQVTARDHMLEKHPRLKFVGAHLGSIEWSVDELAKRLDKFPNMAVDMAARIGHWQYQCVKDRKKVRAFIIRYQDRILYATDREAFPDSDPEVLQRELRETWASDWKFLVTGERLTSKSFKGAFNGLMLPRKVVDKIYRLNAERWYPLIKRAGEQR